MLLHFAQWLSQTSVSEQIQVILWVIPAVQTIHILGIATVLSAVAMIALRTFGLAGRRLPVAQMAGQYLPWIWGGLLVLALTGVTLIVGEPVRSLVNPAFQLKMAMLAVAVVVTLIFQHTLGTHPRVWSFSDRAALPVRIASVVVVALWMAIAIAGRWIAYMTLGYGSST